MFIVAENQTSVGIVKIDDINATLILGGVDMSAFNLASDGTLTFKVAPDYETKLSYSITVTAKDVENNERAQNITIKIANIDEEAPNFLSDSEFSVQENSTYVGEILIDDNSGSINLIGLNREKFRLNSNKLYFISSPDYETQNSYTLTIEAKDRVNNRRTQNITINIIDVADETAPIFASGDSIVVDVNESNKRVTRLIVDDTQAQLTLSGSDNSAFTIEGDVLFFKETPIYSVQSIYYVTVTAVDNFGNSANQSIRVNVLEAKVADTTPPIFTSANSIEFNENATGVVLRITTDEKTTLTLSGTDKDAFTLSSGGDLSFVNPADYETQNTYYISVTASDESNNTAVQDITVNIVDLYEISNEEYFLYRAEDSRYGVERWVAPLDGNSTTVLKDINTITKRSSVSNVISYNNSTYFYANGEIWKTDGTTTGTIKVVTLPRLSVYASNIQYLIPSGNKFFFLYKDGSASSREQLWVSNGTQDGTFVITDTSANISEVTAWNNGVLFTISDDRSHLWFSDGTVEGTYSTNDSGDNTAFEDVYYYNYHNSGPHLMKTDGTTSGTSTIDIPSAYRSYLKRVGDKVYQMEQDSSYDATFYLIDETLDENRALVDINETLRKANFYSSLGKLFITGYNYLYVVSGSEWTKLTDSTTPVREHVDYNGKQYFVSKSELWETQGTVQTTQKLLDINATTIENLVVENGKLYFSAYNSDISGNTKQLWESDFTQDGTKIVRYIPAERLSNYSDTKLYNLNNHIYCSGYDTKHSYELWISESDQNGEIIGMEILKDININTQDSTRVFSSSQDLDSKKIGNVSYFLASGGSGLNSMYKTDGSYANTQQIFLDLNKSINAFTYHNGSFYLGLDDSIYVSSTENNAQLLREKTDAEYMGPVRNFRGSCKDIVFFTTVNDLWRTDGTFDGTYKLSGVRETSNIVQTTDEHCYFEYSGKLMQSDGSDSNTTEVQGASIVVVNNDIDIADINNSIYYKSSNNEIHKYNTSSGDSVFHTFDDIISYLTDVGESFYVITVENTNERASKMFSINEDGVTQILSSTSNMRVPQFTNVDGIVYFTKDMNIYKTEGTSATTIMVVENTTDPKVSIRFLGVEGSKLFYRYGSNSPQVYYIDNSGKNKEYEVK